MQIIHDKQVAYYGKGYRDYRNYNASCGAQKQKYDYNDYNQSFYDGFYNFVNGTAYKYGSVERNPEFYMRGKLLFKRREYFPDVFDYGQGIGGRRSKYTHNHGFFPVHYIAGVVTYRTHFDGADIFYSY